MSYVIFSILGIVLSLLRYGTYIRAIIRGTTKPHPLTWLSAGLMSGIATFIQYTETAGPTVWVTGVVTLFCLAIGVTAFFYGEKKITRSDWASFAMALCVILVWLLTDQPTLAILLILSIELLSYYPTVRKSYAKPWQEDVVSWSLSAVRWLSATLAVSAISFNSLVYPAFITVCEICFVTYLLVRRYQLRAAILTEQQGQA